MKEGRREKLADRIGRERREESLLPEEWKQQDGAEILLHPEGRDFGLTPIEEARTGPTLLGVVKLADRIGKKKRKINRRVCFRKDGETVWDHHR